MRPGEVENRKRILYGRLPRFGLSRNGRGQGAKAARGLKKFPVSKIYHSPLLRTRQTAHIVSGFIPADRAMSRLLIEVDLIFQGMPVSEYKKIQGNIYDRKYLIKGQESI